MKKVIEKTGSVTLKFIALILALISLLSISNIFFTLKDKNETTPNGKTVTYKKENMNVYIKGNGKDTIVLMTGLGTAAPSLDFEPLAEKLSSKYTVCVPEPYGYGFSDQTDRKRTVENIVDEYRYALKEAGLNPPYVLMPHSISGIYAIYYANMYPDEVKAIVGIDCTLPTQMKYFGVTSSTKYPGIAKIVCPLGISRLITLVSPSTFVANNETGEYSAKNIEEQKKIASWNGYNKTIINEANMVDENVKATLNMKFKENLPLLFFTTDSTAKKARTDGKTSESFFETYITNSNIQEVVTLGKNHYIHRTESSAICEKTENFLDKTLKSK